MLVPPVPHSILGTANIVCRVVAGTIDIIDCMGGQAVQPFVDGISSIVSVLANNLYSILDKRE